MVKNLPTKQETWAQSLGWEDPLKKGLVTHSSILAKRIPWRVHGCHKVSDMTGDFHFHFSVYSCHLFLISYASLGFNPFLSFIGPIFAWNISLVSLIFLMRAPVFPILFFSSISLHWSLRMAFLSLLAILWNSAFKWMCLSFSPLPFSFFFFWLLIRVYFFFF